MVIPTVMWNANGAAVLENSLAGSYKTKTQPLWPATALLGIDPRKMKVTGTQKPIHKWVFTATCDNQNLATVWLSFSG
jgi:hypothetical protein